MQSDFNHNETPNIFDRIASSWYNFRHFSIFGDELRELTKKWQKGKLLNLGCAHGPDFPLFAGSNFELYGVDSSLEMLRLAQRYATKFHFEVKLFLADVTALPFTDATFDWAISVATYHHLRTSEARSRAFSELYRILKPGGEAFVTVWNRTQPRFIFSPKETLVPWRGRNETLYRYYYLFSYPELARLAKEAGFAMLKVFPERSYHGLVKYFSRNICLLVKKEK